MWGQTDKESPLTGAVHRATIKTAKLQHARWYGNAAPQFGSAEHWAELCAQVVARGRGHLLRHEQDLRCRMAERDRRAVQAVVGAWSVPGRQ